MDIVTAHIGHFPAIGKYDSHIPADRLRDCIGRNQVFLLQDSGESIGVLRWSLFWQTIPFLDLLYIDEACRGKGYGRQAMAHWESAMAALGYRYVMLSTQADETGKSFYEKLGYHPIGAFRPPEQSADELMYLKEL